MPERPAKHSLTLAGHRTSVTLEDPFWHALRRMAGEQGLSLNELAARIDAARPPGVGLASALRVAVLDWAMHRGPP
jgi:predicted DNA-binding ribbon-helix-helix protein